MTNNPTRVILHCAATPDYKETKYNIGHIRKWHLERGWKDIGYHKYIDRGGIMFQGRDENIVGAHVKGHNQDSLGVCYEGTWFPTAWQWDTIFNLYRTWYNIYKIDFLNWYCHNQFSSKECPGFDVKVLRDMLSKIAV